MNDKKVAIIEKDAEKEFKIYWKGISKFFKAPHIDYEYCKAIAFCSFMDGFRNGRGLWKDESKKPIRKLYAHEKKTQQFYKK